jgi:hypothetical protein
VEAFCARNGITKEEIYDPTQPNLAVQLALMETQTISETKDYLQRNGVNIEVLSILLFSLLFVINVFIITYFCNYF